MSTNLHQVVMTSSISVLGFLIGCVLSPSLPLSTLFNDQQLDFMPRLRVVMQTSFGLGSAVSGVLMSWRGAQLTSLVGGVMVSVGLLATVAVSSVDHGIVTYGAVAGFGCGLVYVSLYGAVRVTYKKYTNLVYGILGCVSFAGYVITSEIAWIHATSDSWRDALLIMSGIVMNTIPLSLLLPGRTDRQTNGYTTLENNSTIGDSAICDNTIPDNTALGNDTTLWNKTTPDKRTAQGCNTTTRDNCYRIVKHGDNGFVVKRHSDDMQSLSNTLTHPTPGVLSTIDRIKMNTKIFRKTGFYGVLFAGCLYSYGSSVILCHLVAYTTQLQRHSNTLTSIILIIIGVTVCVTKLCQSVLLGRVDPLYWYTGSACLGGLFTFTMMIPLHVVVVFTYTGVLGVSLAGAGNEVISPIIYYLAGPDNFELPFGLFIGLNSLAGIIGCPLTSVWIFEKSQSFKPVFMMAAASMTLAAIFCFLLRGKLLRRPGRRERIYARRVVSQEDHRVQLVTSL